MILVLHLDNGFAGRALANVVRRLIAVENRDLQTGCGRLCLRLRRWKNQTGNCQHCRRTP
jgi:hypothetical protein